MMQTMIYRGPEEQWKGKEAQMKPSPHLLPGWALFKFPGELKFRPMLLMDFVEPIEGGQPVL